MLADEGCDRAVGAEDAAATGDRAGEAAAGAGGEGEGEEGVIVMVGETMYMSLCVCDERFGDTPGSYATGRSRALSGKCVAAMHWYITRNLGYEHSQV